MKQKKCKTAGWRKKRIGILASLILIFCMILGYVYIRYADGYRTFRAPDHEAAAQKGTPSGENVKNYEELPVKEGYRIGLDTTPRYQDGRLYLNAANCANNTVWLLIRAYCGDELIAETGILYPGEYIADVPCTKTLAGNENIVIKTLAYEPDTYHSEGVAQISCKITAE